MDIWKHTERKLQSFDWEKDQKSKAKWPWNSSKKRTKKGKIEKAKGKESIGEKKKQWLSS